MNNNNIQQAKQIIKDADAILITAGAGMGVDSGLPDFRGTKGFWKAYPPIEKLGLGFEDMANPKWFATNPLLAWAFYGHRLNLYKNTIPHDGFKMLLDLVKEKNDNYFVFTSNVDGQFQKAGFDIDKIYEVHGSIHHLQCTQNCNDKIWEAKDEYIDVDMDKFEAINIPLCDDCGDIARPNILMFGDWSWNHTRTKTQEQKYYNWLHSLNKRKKKIVIIELGAGTNIPTIRNHGQQLAKSRKNVSLIRINPREFIISKHYGVSIPLGGLDGLQRVCK